MITDSCTCPESADVKLHRRLHTGRKAFATRQQKARAVTCGGYSRQSAPRSQTARTRNGIPAYNRSPNAPIQTSRATKRPWHSQWRGIRVTWENSSGRALRSPGCRTELSRSSRQGRKVLPLYPRKTFGRRCPSRSTSRSRCGWHPPPSYRPHRRS